MPSNEDRVAARHLRGWLAYAFARYGGARILYGHSYILYSEVFAVVGLGVFLPVCLEQFARDNGYLLPDKTVKCSSATGMSLAMVDDVRCVVEIGWGWTKTVWIDTASFRCASFILPESRRVYRHLQSVHLFYICSITSANRHLSGRDC